MIDTAQAYHNEEGVGNTIRKSDIDCKEIFLVSKIWISNYGYKKVKASIDKSLDRLQTDHIDLMLLHQPFCDWYSAYRALEKVYKEGKLRAIGVSNFYPDHLSISLTTWRLFQLWIKWKHTYSTNRLNRKRVRHTHHVVETAHRGP